MKAVELSVFCKENTSNLGEASDHKEYGTMCSQTATDSVDGPFCFENPGCGAYFRPYNPSRKIQV